jgi:integrase/recombinase XerC
LRQNIIKELPTTKIVSPKVAKRLPTFLQENQMSTLLDRVSFAQTFEGKTERIIIELLYITGMSSI